METEIRIQVPEGMEIDKKNSTFECIKFKPKGVTYMDIQNKLDYNCNIVLILEHRSKCITFRKLLEVADYLNDGWKPDWNNTAKYKYFIVYDHEKNEFRIDYRCYRSSELVYFSSKENALKAIEIIGEEELKQFFS